MKIASGDFAPNYRNNSKVDIHPVPRTKPGYVLPASGIPRQSATASETYLEVAIYPLLALHDEADLSDL